MRRIIGAAGALMVLVSPASAQLIADSNEPIDITGDVLEGVDDVVTWTGNVTAVQGEAILTAARFVTKFGKERDLQSFEAMGAVRYSNGKEAITGETAFYDASARSITMTENVVVTQGETVMTGGALIYWIDTGAFRFTAPEGRRIRGIFHTKSGPPQL